MAMRTGSDHATAAEEHYLAGRRARGRSAGDRSTPADLTILDREGAHESSRWSIGLAGRMVCWWSTRVRFDRQQVPQGPQEPDDSLRGFLVPLTEAHAADADALACGSPIGMRMASRNEESARWSCSNSTKQIHWAAEQARDLQEPFAKMAGTSACRRCLAGSSGSGPGRLEDRPRFDRSRALPPSAGSG